MVKNKTTMKTKQKKLLLSEIRPSLQACFDSLIVEYMQYSLDGVTHMEFAICRYYLYLRMNEWNCSKRSNKLLLWGEGNAFLDRERMKIIHFSDYETFWSKSKKKLCKVQCRRTNSGSLRIVKKALFMKEFFVSNSCLQNHKTEI